MIDYNPLLCLDFYKTCHAEQYPKGLTRMVSYYTPRMSRLADTDKVTMFGLQASAVNSPCLRDVLGLSLKIKRRLATSLGEDCWAAADDSMEFESPPRDYTR